MYSQVMHQWKMLPEWQKELKNQYTLGELYRMSTEGCDFFKLVQRMNGTIIID